jgi:hypothetical protein
MIKRAVASLMWFFTAAWAWNYVSLMTGLPSLVGAVIGASLAFYVLVDPLHRVWQVRDNLAPALPTFELPDTLPSPS